MAPASPTGSAYDLSDDEEGEYSKIMHSTSGRGVKLLFSKSKVYVHPSPSSKDNISGFIALVQQKSPNTQQPTSSSSTSEKSSSFLLSWVPDSSLGDNRDAYLKVETLEDSPMSRRTPLIPAPPTTLRHSGTVGYAFAVPLSEIYSLLIRPPSLGWWFGSVVINTRAGDSLPALFFHDDECQSTILQKKRLVRENMDPFNEDGRTFWGGDEVLRWLRKYVNVEKSGADPSVYLIEPSEEDKIGFSATSHRRKASANAAGSLLTGPKASGSNDAGMDPLMKALKSARWGFLEKMSQVTTFARKTAQELVENPNIPPQVRKLMKNSEVQTLQDEFDSARVYLARWAMGIAEQSEKDKSQRIWIARDVLDTEQSDLGEFEILDPEVLGIADKYRPVTMKEWDGFFDPQTGKLQVTSDEVKERIFHGGLDPNDGVRKEAWLFLLGVYAWDSTAEERKTTINSKRDEFIRLKGAWWERMLDGTDTPESAEWFKEQKHRIEKDVHRTDRHIPLFEGEDIPHPDPESPFADVGTNVHLEQMKDMLLTYNEYNKDLGYVQGMSDLLSPIYAVMQDDAIAFWGFVNFMERMERNFLRDQSGMRAQLLTLDHLVQLMDPNLYLHLQSADSTNFFFFFRMILVWYKREFKWSDVLRLWESLWTDFYSSNFHLFIALAILVRHRDVIMAHLKHFDEVLKYINELSNTIDLETTLMQAEALFRRFQSTVQVIDKRSNFPEPSVRQRKPQAEFSNTGTNSASSGRSVGELIARPIGAEKQKVVSPELRSLLRRKVEVVKK